MIAKPQLARALLIIALFLLGALSASRIGPVQAQTPLSVNMIVNPGFEKSPPLTGWVGDTFDDGNYNSTITANSTLAHTGTYSARLDVSNNSTAIKLGVKTSLAHITLIQYLPANTLFGGLTNRSDGLNLWFYLQPKFSGFPLFELRVRAGSTSEMDYIFVNPSLGLGFGNSTTGSEGGKPLKQFILPLPLLSQWTQLSRNIRADWLAPLKLSGGTVAPGFQLNDTFDRFEADAYFFQDSLTGNIYAETAWVDDVAIFNDVIPLPSFSFQDRTGYPTDNRIVSKIFNASGVETQRSPGFMIRSYEYNLQVYYRGYLILKDPITPTTPSLIQLAMVPIDNSRTGYVAINSLGNNVTIRENTESQIAFNVSGTGQSMIVADSAIQPVAVANGPTSITSWTYNSTLGIISITTTGVGPFSISYRPLIQLPRFTFEDITGSSVSGAISWTTVNSHGAEITLAPGTLVPDSAYSLDVTYGSYAIYHATITQALQFPIHLQMLPLNASSGAYIVFNSTINSISILENSQSHITFSSTGTGPSLVVVRVPAKPISIERDGTSISTWSYNSTSRTVEIESATLGTFSIVFINTTNETPIFLALALIGGIAIAASAVVIWRRRLRTRQSNPEVPWANPKLTSANPTIS
jgi:hypothetical protein